MTTSILPQRNATHDAPQHGPRPLPLFLEMLRSETATDPDRMARALAGLRRYQHAPRPKPGRAAPVRFRKGRARLRDFGGAGRDVVFVPSLINPPGVLHLTPETSLIGWVRAQGFRCWLLDWGTPLPRDHALDIAAHVCERLVPLIAKLPAPPLLVGYCLGGTMAWGAAAAIPVAGVATIAAPWHFSGYGAVEEMTALWRAARPLCEAMGLVPMEVLQTAFWKLDPKRTFAKYERLAEASDAAVAEFIALEDWANAGAPLTYAAGAELFEGMIEADRPGRGEWHVGGRVVDPLALPCPAIEFVSVSDRIVPAATAANLADRRDLGAGHVGMVVGRGRMALWEPLGAWLRGVAG
jgi:polyhydroxyalkanoate synthase